MAAPLRLFGALAVGVLIATPLAAQRNSPSTYAITNARLIPVSGPALERGTVVVRNGLIAAIGANVTVPADARVIDGAGMTVYPGLIDAYGSLALPRPTGGGGGGGGGGFAAQLAAQAAGGGSSGPNSNYPSGLRPERSAVDQLSADADAFTGPHSAGITAAQTAIGNGVMRGQSAVINLGGTDPFRMVIKSPVAQHIGFSGAGAGYPGSLMGVITSIRQMFLDAQRYRDWQAAYARNPRGMRRPDPDPALDALQPVLAREQAVVMAANSQREIERALDIAKEFNLRVIIAGGSEAHLVAERLRAEGVPVLLSTNFPRRTAAPAADADPEPLRLLRQRAEAPKVPGMLQSAGVRYAFQSGGITNWGDWLGNARRAVENGLSAEQALRAMTLGSAEILGVADRLGTLEAGKIANLTVASGDLFAEGTRVTHVFVDGVPTEIPAPAAGAAGRGGAPARPGADGQWTMAVEVDGQRGNITLSLVQGREQLYGFFGGDFGSGEITQGVILEDGSFRFTAFLTLHATGEEAEFSGAWVGNELAGDVAIIGHETGKFAGLRAAAR
jgi:imidazolonepropionase-like amidohydrolase